jgi:hypothetical protein
MTGLSAKYLNEVANSVIKYRVNYIVDNFVDHVLCTAKNGDFEDFLQLEENVTESMANRIVDRFTQVVPGTKIKYDQTVNIIYLSWYLLVDDETDDELPPLVPENSIW